MTPDEYTVQNKRIMHYLSYSDEIIRLKTALGELEKYSKDGLTTISFACYYVHLENTGIAKENIVQILKELIEGRIKILEEGMVEL